jgi:glutathione S-transferase
MFEVLWVQVEELRMSLVLHGYRYSVYLRIARMVLAEKGVTYRQIEVNPFAAEIPKDYLDLTPFRRVPTLVHGDFVLYETEAITRYIDEALPGPALQPTEPRQRARMAQIISIIDSYGYCRWCGKCSRSAYLDLVSVGRLTKLRYGPVSRVPFASSALSKPLSRLMDRLREERFGRLLIFILLP